MAKPTNTARWASVSGRVEPTAAEKDAGLAEGDGLPNTYMNHQWGIGGDWFAWLDGRLFDGYTVPTDGSDCRLTGDPDTGLRVRNAAGALLPVECAEPVADDPNMAVNGSYLIKNINSFLAVEHDYGGAPLKIASGVKTYVPFSDFTPTIPAQQVFINATELEFDNLGIFHIDVYVTWVNGPAAPYARSLIIDVGGTEHRAFDMVEVSGAVSRTQHFSMDFELTAADPVKVAMYQISGSSDYAKVIGVSVHQVGKRIT